MKWLIASALAALAAVIITRQRMAEADAADAGAGDSAPPPEPLFTFPSFSFPSFDMPTFTLPSVPTDWPSWAGMQTLDDQPDQLPSPVESFIVNTEQQAADLGQRLTGAAPAPAAPGTAATNRQAFLDMISFSEGTSGPNGYRTLFGGGLFTDTSDHPRQRFQFTNSKNQTLTTTAAGRYQFLVRTWDELKKKLNLPDFGPDSQDLAALELIRQRGALDDVDAGRATAAINKISKVWASLPGAGYAQPERKLSTLLAQYRAAGGNLEA